METIAFSWKYLWDITLIIIGLILIFVAFRTFKKELKIRKIGIKTTAQVIRFNYEESLEEYKSPTKIPVFIFHDKLNNQITVKGKSSSSCEMYETTPIYYNPAKPETEYYLPKKDFMVKFLFFFFGLALLCSGLYYIDLHYAELNSF